MMLTYVLGAVKNDKKRRYFNRKNNNYRNYIGAQNYLVTRTSKDELYDTNFLPDKLKQINDLRRCISYKLFVK